MGYMNVMCCVTPDMCVTLTKEAFGIQRLYSFTSH